MGFFRPRGRAPEEIADWIWLDPNPDDPSRDPVDQQLALTFPEELCRELGFIPIAVDHGVISIAVAADAHPGRARTVVMDQARCAVSVLGCDREQLDRALARTFQGAGFFHSPPARHAN